MNIYKNYKKIIIIILSIIFLSFLFTKKENFEDINIAKDKLNKDLDEIIKEKDFYFDINRSLSRSLNSKVRNVIRSLNNKLFVKSFNDETGKSIDKQLKNIIKGFPNIFSKITHTTLETDKKFNVPFLVVGNGIKIDKKQIDRRNRDKLKFQKLNLHTNGVLSLDNKLCIGDSCLEKKHIEMLIGNRDFWLKSEKNNKYLRNFDYTHNHKADGKPSRGPKHSHGNLFDTKINKLGMFIGGKGNEEKFRLRL